MTYDFDVLTDRRGTDSEKWDVGENELPMWVADMDFRTAPGKRYIPFASVSETCRDISVTCIAPTKTFNIAGLQTAAVCAANPVLRHKMWRAMNTDDVAEPSAFATTAAMAAYEKGAPWLDALRAYLWENRKTAEEFIAREIPGMRAVRGEATYLLWIDISGLTEDSAAFARFLREKTGLYISAGAPYGKGGVAFLRMNLACPRATCLDGLGRLKAGAALFTESKA